MQAGPRSTGITLSSNVTVTASTQKSGAQTSFSTSSTSYTYDTAKTSGSGDYNTYVYTSTISNLISAGTYTLQNLLQYLTTNSHRHYVERTHRYYNCSDSDTGD